ncbi:cytochrome o ubiquinol oxidase subunit IV [Rhodanobacter sp. 7MK24]|uniref:cytochrome o ubiquinol oxidase subunit IV n=1 Tax=Rhodanobacter sp. 7MK24 TaxID=2775922 RepID=UPI00178349EC|nr:cytochrome o ubiquinol oxidase subunit IV [Rhodanobacter sp. 7MK24]MBD8881266.1 cytochrome o ubiquinol oxidase subunit IV [Rhodanobacter sp. 7MK24]
MSHSNSHDHAVHGHEHSHDEHANHGSLRSYLTGFVLAVILTVIPFWLVMGHVFQSHWVTITLVLLLAIVQILVHVVYFLHLDTHSEGGWNMLSFVFTIVLVVIVLGASIWVMYNENTNMMPMSPQYQHNGE